MIPGFSLPEAGDWISGGDLHFKPLNGKKRGPRKPEKEKIRPINGGEQGFYSDNKQYFRII